MLIEITEYFIKEILYKYFSNDNRVNKNYFDLIVESQKQKQSNDINKNIGFYLTELCIKNYDKNLKTYRYLYLWKSCYVDKLLKYFNFNDIYSIKLGLKYYDNICSFFNNLINNTKNMWMLNKEEYINIHKMFNLSLDINYYKECRTLFYKNVAKIEDIKNKENKLILTIKNCKNPYLHEYYDVVLLKENKHVINKIIWKIKKFNFKICRCSNPHTNCNVIDVTSNNFLYINYKLTEEIKEINILECYDNDLIYDFYIYLSTINSL